jgi:hypothetical protein
LNPSDQDIQTQREVLIDALHTAAQQLGISDPDLRALIGRDSLAIRRGGIDPHSKAGEQALMLIRCYQDLYYLMGGDSTQMMHWMHTENRHTQGIPAEQVKSAEGLVAVVEYLDAIRGMN